MCFGRRIYSCICTYYFQRRTRVFREFFDAVYWATISLTTVGYGDIYPVSTLGRIITMLSSVFGIAIVALPAGIITAGYMTELEQRNSHDETREKKE